MEDRLNYIKNMIRMMCCDGEIASREKKFLSRAAKEIGAEVDDWNKLLKEVLAEGTKLYPLQNREKAIATLKSLIVMAKADKKVDQREKEYILRFAKSVGVSNSEWKQTISSWPLWAAINSSNPTICVVIARSFATAVKS